jgi:hypothetical protein
METSLQVASMVGATGGDAEAEVPAMEVPAADATEIPDEAKIPHQLEV